MQTEQLKPIVEAALLASTQPMTVHQLGDLFVEADEVNATQIAMALEALAEDCAGRGVELKEVASGFRYQVRQDVHPWISRMWTEKPSRYSRALLETLALIAYRQPITRPEIEQIRGVVVSSNIIKTMEEREWIRVVGYRDVPGKPALFGTTRSFLDYFNLKSLDQLPPLSEIRDMEDPQLRFEPEPLPARIVRDLPIDPEEELADKADGANVGDAADSAEESADTNVQPTAEFEAEIAHSDQPASDESTDAHTAESDEQTANADAQAAAEPNESGAAERDPVLHDGTPTTTADEAANPAADADPDAAAQDTEEYRA
jgi:segregation and condensation protein B